VLWRRPWWRSSCHEKLRNSRHTGDDIERSAMP